MCSSANPNENSLAERLKRTLKEDFKLENRFVCEEAVLKAIPELIETYNNYRPDGSLEYKTLTQCHNSGRVEKERWHSDKKRFFLVWSKNNLKRHFRDYHAIFIVKLNPCFSKPSDS
jgi:hypothetical protein